MGGASNGKTREGVRISFFVPGVAVTQGSGRAIPHRSTGRAVLIPDNSAGLRSWRAVVASEARAARERAGMAGVLRGPVSLSLSFRFVPPKGRPAILRTEKQIAEWSYPAKRPDLGKLVRAVEDALTGVLYADDSQIVHDEHWKRYGPEAGVYVSLSEVTGWMEGR